MFIAGGDWGKTCCVEFGDGAPHLHVITVRRLSPVQCHRYGDSAAAKLVTKMLSKQISFTAAVCLHSGCIDASVFQNQAFNSPGRVVLNHSLLGQDKPAASNMQQEIPPGGHDPPPLTLGSCAQNLRQVGNTQRLLRSASASSSIVWHDRLPSQ